jgi:hypothetical protein
MNLGAPPPLNNKKNKIKQLPWPLSTVKSNFQKLQAIKKITKSNKKKVTKSEKKSTKTTPHYSGFLVVKQPPAPVLMGVVARSYV